MVSHPNRSTARELRRQLDRANRIIDWMMPYIGKMCPPDNGLYDLNLHCCENRVPKSGVQSNTAPIEQRVRMDMVP